MQATMTTSKGAIRLNLFPDQAPVTVANFVNLVSRGYYDGLEFHRVIANFMVQGGCPQGTGTGGPGYRFEDEFDAALRHDRPGRFSMANAGPGTNGSQFFITHVPTPWLDDKHSIFGEVAGADDQAVVDAIAQGDSIESVTIDGDTGPLLAAQAGRITDWNTRLGQMTDLPSGRLPRPGALPPEAVRRNGRRRRASLSLRRAAAWQLACSGRAARPARRAG